MLLGNFYWRSKRNYGNYRSSGWTSRRRSYSCSSQKHEQIEGVKGHQTGHWLALGTCQVGPHPNG